MWHQAVGYEVRDKGVHHNHHDQDVVLVIGIDMDVHKSEVSAGTKGYEFGPGEHFELHKHEQDDAKPDAHEQRHEAEIHKVLVNQSAPIIQHPYFAPEAFLRRYI